MTPLPSPCEPLATPTAPELLGSHQRSVSAKLLLLLPPVLMLLPVTIAWYLPGRQKIRLVEQQVTTAGEGLLAQVRREGHADLTSVLPHLLTAAAQGSADYHRSDSPAASSRGPSETGAVVAQAGGNARGFVSRVGLTITLPGHSKARGRNRVIYATAGLHAVTDKPGSRREDVS